MNVITSSIKIQKTKFDAGKAAEAGISDNAFRTDRCNLDDHLRRVVESGHLQVHPHEHQRHCRAHIQRSCCEHGAMTAFAALLGVPGVEEVSALRGRVVSMRTRRIRVSARRIRRQGYPRWRRKNGLRRGIGHSRSPGWRYDWKSEAKKTMPGKNASSGVSTRRWNGGIR